METNQPAKSETSMLGDYDATIECCNRARNLAVGAGCSKPAAYKDRLRRFFKEKICRTRFLQQSR